MGYNVGNDKAIEFKSRLLKINNMIEHLNEVGITAKGEKIKLEIVLKTLNSEIDNTYNVASDTSNLQVLNKMTLENCYNKAIHSLINIEMELSRYNDYFSAYYYCESLKKEMKPNVDKEELDKIADTIVSLLKRINYSDTRCYDSEKKIVESLYKTAYQVMKLELRLNGTSKIFDFAKNDPITNSYLNNEVKEEIKKDENIPYLDKIKSTGIDCDYLDKSLLLFLSLKNGIDSINDIIKELKKLKLEIDKNVDEMLKEQEEYYDNKSFRKSNLKEYRKEISKLVAAYTLIATIITGAIGFAYHASKKVVEHTTYMTKIETYNSQVGKLSEPKITYESKIEDDFNTTMTKYTPWEQKRNGKFKREVISYDVDEIELEDIREYLDLDIDSLGIKRDTTIEKKESLTLDDLYDEAYYEITRIIQDYDKESVIEGPIASRILMGVLLFMIASSPVLPILAHKGSDLANSKHDAKKALSYSKENLMKMREALEAYKRLYDKDLEMRNKFNTIFNNYRAVLSDEDVKKLVLKEKPSREIK